jgi:hypothetical protein
MPRAPDASLCCGIGQRIVLFPVGLPLFEVKIRKEERLMVGLPRYRRQVPHGLLGATSIATIDALSALSAVSVCTFGQRRVSVIGPAPL